MLNFYPLPNQFFWLGMVGVKGKTRMIQEAAPKRQVSWSITLADGFIVKISIVYSHIDEGFKCLLVIS